MAQNKSTRRPRHDGYYGVTFQNEAQKKKPLDMLHAVMLQDGADLERANRQPLISNSTTWDRPQAA